jgi:hypothetical protein
MTDTEEDQALETLRHMWGDVYELGAGLDGFWAQRRDNRGQTLIDEDPGELHRQILEDYAADPPGSRQAN